MSLYITQNALSTSAELIFPARNVQSRRLTVKNHDASIVVYVGADEGVTSANGYALASGASVEFEEHEGEIWAIAASGTPSVGLIEQFD